MALLGGLAVLVSETGGDLVPGGVGGAGGGDELVLADVELAAFGKDGVEGGRCPAGGRGPGGRQRDLDVEQRRGLPPALNCASPGHFLRRGTCGSLTRSLDR